MSKVQFLFEQKILSRRATTWPWHSGSVFTSHSVVRSWFRIFLPLGEQDENKSETTEFKKVF